MFRMTFGWISLLIGYKLHLSDHLWWVPCNILEVPVRVLQTGPQLLGTLESPGVGKSMLSENNLKGCPLWDLPGSQENPLWLFIAESSRETLMTLPSKKNMVNWKSSVLNITVTNFDL